MSRFWEIVFCVPLLFRRHVCLSKLKHLRSRESPLTARKTVFSHLNTVYFGVLHFEKYSKGRILETYFKKKQYSVGIKFVDLQDKFLFEILAAVQKKSPQIALFWLEWFGRLKRWATGFESSFHSFSQDLEDVFENHHLAYCLFFLCC